MESMITLTDKKELSMTGCKKINAFNDKEFLIETVLGNLKVNGNNLEMGQFEIDKGLLIIKGEISALSYQEYKPKVEGFFKKIFK